MGTSFTPKSPTTTIPEIPINSRIVNRANEPHYTCPAGKKAFFKGYVICTSLGAASSGTLRDPTDTFALASWVASGGSISTNSNVLPQDFRYFIEMQLAAGDEIRTTQNSGTNAEFEVIGTIKELPA